MKIEYPMHVALGKMKNGATFIADREWNDSQEDNVRRFAELNSDTSFQKAVVASILREA